MVSKKVWVLATVIYLAIAGISYAGTEKGMGELAASFTVQNQSYKSGDSRVSSTTYIGTGSLGYFVTRQIELGVMLLGGGVTDGTSNTFYGGQGQFKFNFCFDKAAPVVPYLGVQAGYFGVSNGKSTGAASYGGLGGIRFFLSENTSLNLELNYQRTNIDNTDYDLVSGLVGFSFFFGGGGK